MEVWILHNWLTSGSVVWNGEPNSWFGWQIFWGQVGSRRSTLCLFTVCSRVWSKRCIATGQSILQRPIRAGLGRYSSNNVTWSAMLDIFAFNYGAAWRVLRSPLLHEQASLITEWVRDGGGFLSRGLKSFFMLESYCTYIFYSLFVSLSGWIWYFDKTSFSLCIWRKKWISSFFFVILSWLYFDSNGTLFFFSFLGYKTGTSMLANVLVNFLAIYLF